MYKEKFVELFSSPGAFASAAPSPVTRLSSQPQGASWRSPTCGGDTSTSLTPGHLFFFFSDLLRLIIMNQ